MKSTRARNLLTKSLIVGAVLVFGGTVAADANAGGYSGHKHRGHSGHRHHPGHRPARHHRHHRHGHHYRHHHHGRHGAYLAGGLILGSLLTNAYHRSYEPAVERRTVIRESAAVERQGGRRLYRDRDGNCFERSTSRYGEDLMVELDPRECAW